MNGSKAISTIVAVIAVMVVVSAVAIPVFDSMSDSVYATEENDVAYYRMSLGDSSTYLKIEMTDTEGVFLVNGESVDVTTRGSNDILMAVSDALLLRLTSSVGIQIYGSEYAGSGEGYYYLATEGSYIEFSNGEISIYVASNGTLYSDGSYTMLFYADDDGDWTLNRWNSQWVSDGATVYVANTTSAGGMRQYSLLAVTDGTTETITSKWYDSEANEWVYADPEVVMDVTDTSDLSSYMKPVSYDINGDTLEASGVWIAPYEYKVITDSQQTLLSLVGVIPLLIVVMVLVVAAYGVIRAKDE